MSRSNAVALFSRELEDGRPAARRAGMPCRVAFDAPPRERDQAELRQPLQHGGRDPPPAELGALDPVRCRRQQPNRFLLTRGQFRRRVGCPVAAESARSAGTTSMALCRQVRDTHRAKRRRAADERPRDGQQAVALESQDRAVRAAALADQGVDSQRLLRRELLEDLAPGAPFEQHPRVSGVGDLRVPLALDPGARRHRRADRFTGAARVILGHPQCQRDNLRRQERFAVQDVDDRLDAVVLRRRRRRPRDHAGDDALAERHEDTGADDWID